MKSLRSKMDRLKECADGSAFFLGIREIRFVLGGLVHSVDVEVSNFKNIELRLKLDKCLDSFNEIANFGVVQSSSNRADIKDHCPIKMNSAQVIFNGIFESLEIKCSFDKSFKMDTNTMVKKMNIGVISGTSFVIADENNKRLLLYHETDLCYFALPNCPFDVLYIHDATIAVTFGEHNHVQIFEIKLDDKYLQERSTLDLNYHCFGMSTDGDDIYVVTYPLEITVLNKSFEIKRKIELNATRVYNITAYKQQLYFTNWNKGLVLCADENGIILWRKETKFLHAVTCDSFGNLLLASYDSSQILILSPDGRNKKQILSEKDFIKKTSGIAFDIKSRRLFVGSRKGTDLRVLAFDFKY